MAHGFLILVLELGFQRLENTLYYTVNIWNNTMKETNRVVNLYVAFSLQGFQGNLYVLCVNSIVYFPFVLKNLYALVHLKGLKLIFDQYQRSIWLHKDTFVVECLAWFLGI